MGVLFAAIAALSYGVADYCGGRSSRHASAVAVAFWAEAAGLVIVLGLLPVIDEPFPLGQDLALGLLTAAGAAVGLAAFYHALSGGAMSVVAPTTAVVSAVVPVGVGLLQGERPGVGALFGAALAVVAIALVSGAGGRVSRPPFVTFVFAGVAGLGFAAVFIALDATSEASGWWPVIIARAGTLPLLWTASRWLGQSLRVPRNIAPLVGIGGLFDMTSNLLYLTSTGYGMLAVVSVITALYPASTVCLAYLLDGERLERPQRIGLVLALLALALVAIGH